MSEKLLAKYIFSVIHEALRQNTTTLIEPNPHNNNHIIEAKKFDQKKA